MSAKQLSGRQGLMVILGIFMVGGGMFAFAMFTTPSARDPVGA
jgi:hypothetical protein